MSHRQKSDQRGIAHLVLVLIIVAVVAVIGYVGWKVMNNKNTKSTTTSSSTVPSKSSAEASCLAKYHDKDLCKFVAAQAVKPFEKTSVKVTMTGTSNGTQGTWTLEQDGKGNNSLSITGGGQTINVVTYNGQSYTQTSPGGTWVTYGKAGSTSSTTAQDNPSSSLSDALGSLNTTTFTKLGTEACGNLTCIKYKIVDKASPNATQYAWIDTRQHLLRQYFESGIGAAGDSLTMTVSYEKVTISKPSPVQDLSASSPATQY